MTKPTKRVRITGGEFRGRYIRADIGVGTHPMGDRPRLGLMNSLMARGVITDANVLDAFAGTGALGLEALSRGAARCDFIERYGLGCKVISDNITTLGVSDRARVIHSDVRIWGEEYHEAPKYDLILADPPYDNPQFSTIFLLTKALKQNGLMVLSYPGRVCEPKPNNGVVVVDDLCYGEATLALYRKM